MIIEHKEDYTLISQGNTTNITEFNVLFKEKHNELTDKNLIIILSENESFKDEDFFILLQCSQLHLDSGTTFVVVCDGADVDNFPETFNITPTLVEAEDILEMENIQRDLGF